MDIEDRILKNYYDYSSYICTIEIPKPVFANEVITVQIRRSMVSIEGDSAPFIIITDGKPKIVKQVDISDVITNIALDLFKGFQVIQPAIVWGKEFEDIIKSDDPKEGLGSLFG